METFVTVTDPLYADGTTGRPETFFTTFPTDQPGRTCFGDKGAVLCALTLAAGQQVVVDYRVRVDPADAGHVLGVRASSKTGSVDATTGDDVSVARIVVAEPAAAAPPRRVRTRPPRAPSLRRPARTVARPSCSPPWGCSWSPPERRR